MNNSQNTIHTYGVNTIIFSKSVEVQMKLENILRYFQIKCVNVDEYINIFNVGKKHSIEFVFFDGGSDKLTDFSENIRQLKENLNSEIKIFFIVHNDSNIDFVNLYNLGIDDMLYYPIDKDILKFKLAKYSKNYMYVNLNQQLIFPLEETLKNKICASCDLIEIDEGGVLLISDGYIALGERLIIKSKVFNEIFRDAIIEVIVNAIEFKSDVKCYLIFCNFFDLSADNQSKLRKWIEIKSAQEL